MLSPLPDQRKSAARENPLPTSPTADTGGPAADPARVTGEPPPPPDAASRAPEPPGWDIYDYLPARVDTSQAAVHAAARAYVDAGLSVLPIAADGSKAPDRQRLPWLWDKQRLEYRPGWDVYQV